MVRIPNLVTGLIACLSISACSLPESRVMSNEASFPQGQCELRVDAGHEVSRLTSICAKANVEGSKALLRIASDSRIFFQRGLENRDLTDGVKIIEEVLDMSDSGRQVRQVGGGDLPEEAKDFWRKPAYVFISSDDHQVKVTFNGGSDAVVVSRQSDGLIAADYVIY